MTNPLSLSEQSIAARIERLPISSWHVKMRVAIGVATFFDGFDALAIAFVLPVLVGAWNITPPQIGVLISISFVGQALGALFFGWLAERIGRVQTLTICIAVFGVMALMCAGAQDYDQLFWCRFVQGLGLGGEVPIAAAYINEIARSDRRGGFFMLYESVFTLGVLFVAILSSWVVPRFGWQWLFIIGGIPAIAAIFVRRVCPESPRWLASQGRLEEADRVLREIEQLISRGGHLLSEPKPISASSASTKMRFSELFGQLYRWRTLSVWVLWFCAFVVSFGLTTWMPTLYRTIYHLPVQDALNYSLISLVAAVIGNIVCALAIDRMGRRLWFALAFFLCGIPLIAMWLLAGEINVLYFFLTAVFGSFWIISASSALYLYTGEIYPTRMRALGTSWASFWLRVGAVISPIIVGYLLPGYGIKAVFCFFGAIAIVGGFCALLSVVETKEKILEELSP